MLWKDLRQHQLTNYQTHQTRNTGMTRTRHDKQSKGIPLKSNSQTVNDPMDNESENQINTKYRQMKAMGRVQSKTIKTIQ